MPRSWTTSAPPGRAAVPVTCRRGYGGASDRRSASPSGTSTGRAPSTRSATTPTWRAPFAPPRRSPARCSASCEARRLGARLGAATAVPADARVLGQPGGHVRTLEQQHDRRGTPVLEVRVVLHALGALGPDPLDLLEGAGELLGDRLPAPLVERERAATDVRVLAVEAALGRRRRHVGAGLLEPPGEHVALDDVRDLRPGAVGDLRVDLCRVVVLHGAAPGSGPHQLDQAEARELPDVVADVRERGVQLGRYLARAGDAVVEHAEDVDSQRVRVRLGDARICDVDWNGQVVSCIAQL